MPKLSSLPRPVKLRNLFGAVVLALALLAPASASAWVKEAAPAVGAPFQAGSSMSVLPDGSVRYIGAVGAKSPYTNQLVVRPPAGPLAFASPFPTAFGQGSSTNLLFLSPQDGAGNQLAVRENSPYATAFLAPGADPAAVTTTPIEQVIAIDLAPSGEAAAIISTGSNGAVRFRPAGPSGAWDSPRPLDSAGNLFTYGYAITVDPDGGVFIIYKTGQQAVLLQAYAPPGKPFGAPQQIDVDSFTLGQSNYRYGASSNGHGTFAWDETTEGDNNSEKLWAMTRAPGGLLGDKKLIATSREGGLVGAHIAAATDDGTAYVSYLDSGPIACPNNTRFGGSVLAVKSGAEWTKLNTPTTGNERSDIQAIRTSGNAVGVVNARSHYPNNICSDQDVTSELEVQLGQGASLGPAQVIASENILASDRSTVVGLKGFAINPGGAAAVLVSEPQSVANNQANYLYYQAGAPVGPPAPTKALPAPGKIILSGKKLVARKNQASFEASCQRLPGEGSKLFCSVDALLAIEEKLGGGKARPSAAASAKKGKKARLKVIATAKTVKIPVGKTKTITLKLNKLGKQKLAAAKKAGLKVTLKVTIKRKGYAPNTIEKKVKLVAGKAKAKGKGKKGGK